MHLQPGIYFQEDPAFKGKQRELVAADYVFSFKRFYDPHWKSPLLFMLENSKMLGLTEIRQAALKSRQPFELQHATWTASARSIATRCRSASGNRTRGSSTTSRTRRCSARSRRKWVILWRRHHGASGRHRSVPACTVDSRGTHRAGAQSDLSPQDLRLHGRSGRAELKRRDCAASRGVRCR